MTDRNETPDAGGSRSHINWEDYEAAVRTPEDIRNFNEWMEEEKQNRVEEIRRERFLLKLARLEGNEK